jgi:hypothetical protein
MGTNIERRYLIDGMIAIRVDDGNEFVVHHSVWNDADSKRSIIAGEIESQRQTGGFLGYAGGARPGGGWGAWGAVAGVLRSAHLDGGDRASNAELLVTSDSGVPADLPQRLSCGGDVCGGYAVKSNFSRSAWR